MAKKGARMLFAWLCKKCNKANYVQKSHRDNMPQTRSKYCSTCQVHQDHKSKDKLK